MWVKMCRYAHGPLFAFVLLLALTVDLNGDVLWLGHVSSTIVSLSTFTLAGAVACSLLIKDRGWWRISAVVALLFYAALLVPAFMP
jgi:hypothetical protein